MRELTENEMNSVGGGDSAESMGYCEAFVIGGAGLAIIATVLWAAPAWLSLGAVTEGSLFLTGSGYATVSSASIAAGTTAVRTALAPFVNAASLTSGAAQAAGYICGRIV